MVFESFFTLILLFINGQVKCVVHFISCLSLSVIFMFTLHCLLLRKKKMSYRYIPDGNGATIRLWDDDGRLLFAKIPQFNAVTQTASREDDVMICGYPRSGTGTSCFPKAYEHTRTLHRPTPFFQLKKEKIMSVDRLSASVAPWVFLNLFLYLFLLLIITSQMLLYFMRCVPDFFLLCFVFI